MIIQCEQCQAKFRLDDSKVTDKGVKVRCAKCKHVFTVAREQSEVQEPATGLSFSDDLPDDKGFATEPDEGSSAQLNGDLEGFDFGAGSVESDETEIQPPEMPEPEKGEAEKGEEFSDDDIFGGVTSPSADDLLGSGSIDFGNYGFEDSTDTGDVKAVEESSQLSLESVVDEPLVPEKPDSLDDIPFAGSEQDNAIEPEPSGETLFDPRDEAPETVDPVVEADLPQDTSEVEKAVQDEQDELPPLSITSRRKQNPVTVGVIAVAALAVVGVLAYIGFTVFSEDKEKVAKEAGKISVSAVKASYVENASAGPLLVVSGEALNEYPMPRAALQLKGMVFDAKGQILVSKSAFAGNILTVDQLATLTLEKIETTMANQFGDSLANMEVAPGKKVPFMIVISAPPKEGRDFGVEPTGSTVAAASKPKP